MDRLTKNEFFLHYELFLKNYPNIFILFYCQSANHRFKCFYFILAKIKAIGLKINTFLNSAYPGLFENVLTFIHRWPEARHTAENIP